MIDGEPAMHFKRWCPYHAVFHDLDGFSAAQKLEPWHVRYCLDFANVQKRAKWTLLSADDTIIPKDQIVIAAKACKWIVPGVYDPSGKAEEGAGRRGRSNSTEGGEAQEQGARTAPLPYTASC